MDQARLDLVVAEALDEFWHEVAIAYPEATTGDLPPETVLTMYAHARLAIQEWVEVNVPKPYTATQLLKDRQQGTTRLDDMKNHARDA